MSGWSGEVNHLPVNLSATRSLLTVADTDDVDQVFDTEANDKHDIWLLGAQMASILRSSASSLRRPIARSLVDQFQGKQAFWTQSSMFPVHTHLQPAQLQAHRIHMFPVVVSTVWKLLYFCGSY